MKGACSLVLLGVIAVGCRHVPPDKSLREVKTAGPPVVRRSPRPGEIYGSWISVGLRGHIQGIGHTLLYCFAEGDRYTGAAADDRECSPLGGTYGLVVAANTATLTLDGNLEFKASIVGDHLELQSAGSYILLRRAGETADSHAPD